MCPDPDDIFNILHTVSLTVMAVYMRLYLKEQIFLCTSFANYHDPCTDNFFLLKFMHYCEITFD